jgi:hypothetical protein
MLSDSPFYVAAKSARFDCFGKMPPSGAERHETTRKGRTLRIIAAAGVTLLVVALAVLFFKWVFS